MNRIENKYDSGSNRIRSGSNAQVSKPQPKVFATKKERPIFLTPGFLILALIGLTCVFVLMAPIAEVAQSQTRNDELQAELIAEQTDLESAKTELAKWNDRNYLIAQARENLGYVQTGEVKVSLIGDLDQLLESSQPSESETTDPKTDASKLTWYQRVLESFE